MFARYEFQARSSPHLHIFLWIDSGNALTSGSAENIVDIIYKTISTKLPDKDKNLDKYRLVST